MIKGSRDAQKHTDPPDPDPPNMEKSKDNLEKDHLGPTRRGFLPKLRSDDFVPIIRTKNAKGSGILYSAFCIQYLVDASIE
jgi:hypothetical protein